MRRQHLLAAEREQLTCKGGGALGGAGDLLGRAPEIRLGPETLQEKFRVARDHHQEIVEIVCDASGEPANGLHLLGVAELLF